MSEVGSPMLTRFGVPRLDGVSSAGTPGTTRLPVEGPPGSGRRAHP